MHTLSKLAITRPCTLVSFCSTGQCLRRRADGDLEPGCPFCSKNLASTLPGSLQCTATDSRSNNLYCPLGTGVMPNQQGCYNCTGNSVNDGTSLLCRACPRNLLPNAARTNCSGIVCPASFRNNGTSCVSCPPFHASSSSGMCRDVGVECGPGRSVVYAGGSFGCVNCPPNTFCGSGRCIISSR